MKSSIKKLISLGQKFTKYAGVNAETIRADIEKNVWTSLRNASTHESSGVMPFDSMAQQDGIIVSFDVTRDDHMFSRNITVSNLKVEPAEKSFAIVKYEALPQQIEAYLDRNWEIFRSKYNGEDVDYNNFTLHLTYPDNSGSSIASK